MEGWTVEGWTVEQDLTLVDVVPAMVLNRLYGKFVPRRRVVLGVCCLRLDDLAGKLTLWRGR